MEVIRKVPVVPLNDAEYELAELMRALLSEAAVQIGRMDEFERLQKLPTEEIFSVRGMSPAVDQATVGMIAAMNKTIEEGRKSAEDVARLFRHARERFVRDWVKKALAQFSSEDIERMRAQGFLRQERKT